MSLIDDEVLSLFISLYSNDRSLIQCADKKLIELTNKPGFSNSLIRIITGNSILEIYRFSAGIQLKNLIEKHWSRGDYFSNEDKHLIRSQILSCAFVETNKKGKFYHLIADIISKISRTDWNIKWPDLFNQLFTNNEWITIFKVCKVQSSRRVSQGLLMFKQLANTLTREIYKNWNQFIALKSLNGSSDLLNMSYELKCICLFIRYSHLLTTNDEEFCTCIDQIISRILSNFTCFVDFYISLNREDPFKEDVSKLLKCMVLVLINYQHKSPNDFKKQSTKAHALIISSFSKLKNYCNKYDKLILLLLNYASYFLKCVDNQNYNHIPYDLDFIDVMRSFLLTETEESIEQINNDPESCLEVVHEKDGSIISYDSEALIEELMCELIKRISKNYFEGFYQIIQTYLGRISNMNFQEIDSVIYFLGLSIKSIDIPENSLENKWILQDATLIAENIKEVLLKKNMSDNMKMLASFILKRCIWMISRWVVKDTSNSTVVMERIYTASQWCFKLFNGSTNNSQTPDLIKFAVALFINHLVESLDKLPSDFTDSEAMHEVFLNPAISAIVSTLDITTQSDSHTRLIDILIKLFNITNMWGNINLVKSCANSIYSLWIGINWPSREMVILRDRLLECLSTIVKSCDPSVIQPILPILSNFVVESLQLIIGCNNNIDYNRECLKINCDVLLENALHLWYNIIQNSEAFIEQLNTIFTLTLSIPDQFLSELTKEQTSTILEIIQSHFILRIMSGMDAVTFSELTSSTWKLMSKLTWNPKYEEDLCIMQVQIFDLWILGFTRLFKQSPRALLDISIFSMFLVERVKELFTTTKVEPSNDHFPCLTNSTLTVLGRLCLFDREIVNSLCQHLAANDVEYGQLLLGLLDRWLLRIDNQSSSIMQQVYLLAAIQWLKCCHDYDCRFRQEESPNLVLGKMELLVNCCLQVHSNWTQVEGSSNWAARELTQISELPIPGNRHLRLAYLHWNPLLETTNKFEDFVSTLLSELGTHIGGVRYLELFFTAQLDPTIRSQFVQIFGVNSDNDSNNNVNFETNSPSVATTVVTNK